MAESNSEVQVSQTSATSTSLGDRRWFRRSVITALIAYWLLMFTATHVPKIPKDLEPGFSDKWQHYVAYAGLGFLLGASWSLRRRLTWGAGFALLATAALYGAFDESTQPLFGRDAELLDWRADVIGAVTGLVLYAFAAGLVRRLRIGAGYTGV